MAIGFLPLPLAGTVAAPPNAGWRCSVSDYPPRAIILQADAGPSTFVPKNTPAPVGIVGIAWWRPADDAQPSPALQQSTRSPDETTPFFRPSQVPVPTRWLPTTGGDLEKRPPIPRSPDEATSFFVRSPSPVPTRWPLPTGADVERLPSIKRPPDESYPFFVRSPSPVPTAWLPKTGEDVERLPPIGRSPDEAYPFYVRSPVPVPIIWLPKSGEDVERLPPVGRSPDEAIPYFRPPQSQPVGIFGMAWFMPSEPINRSYPGVTDQKWQPTWTPQSIFAPPPPTVTVEWLTRARRRGRR